MYLSRFFPGAVNAVIEMRVIMILCWPDQTCHSSEGALCLRYGLLQLQLVELHSQL